MRLASLALALATACSPVAAAPPPVEHPPAATPAAPDVAALRAEGPPALARLLARYDQLGAEPTRRALAETIDRVAGQRHATVARLFWYTDLDAARAAARAQGKPILSLRMLGRLDEELSCANSRFFRTTLYPDAAVGALLRERFVLHWSSERPVPVVTIDFGDGRTLASTVTGNSAHFVLDEDGRPLDVLPGLYAPATFVRELTAALALHASLRGQDPAAAARTLARYHRAAEARLASGWAALGPITMIDGARTLLTAERTQAALAAAQRATVSKAYVEVPLLKTVDVGADPGALPDDVALWAEIGQRLLGLGGAPVLGPDARRLVESLLAAPAPGVAPLDDAARAAVIARLEQTVVADTALAETRLRPPIRSYLRSRLEAGAPPTFDELDAWIYEVVFHTPRSDAWLGLLPRDTFTGLPAGAIVALPSAHGRAAHAP